ncbi:MAG: hypothetical protein GF329_03250 [Candidatus Lokiarchaeota archaeon]|nr:hypothetical protein [Candidatus Lokiarchaeota archaeon]
MDITLFIFFALIGGIALIILIFLLIEEGDEIDIPLIPITATICFFGILGSILTMMELEILWILIIGSGVSIGIFLSVYFGMKYLTTESENLKDYIGSKAIVEIQIEPNSTGRIQIKTSESIIEFPARSENLILKNYEVVVKDFIGSVAIVAPTKDTLKKMKRIENDFITCKNCKATIEAGSNICPYCGEKIENL